VCGGLRCSHLVSAIGIDVTSGQPPSKAQMFKLAMSSKFRDGAKKVVVELQNAGIDLSSKVRHHVPLLFPAATDLHLRFARRLWKS